VILSRLLKRGDPVVLDQGEADAQGADLLVR